MYYKGSNLLHTIRTIVDNDTLWRETLRGLNKEFYHKTTTTAMVEDFMSRKLNQNLAPLFDQYLRTITIPTFEYKVDKKKLSYRYTNVISDFTMPISIVVNGNLQWITPTDKWQTIKISKKIDKVIIPDDFYINTTRL